MKKYLIILTMLSGLFCCTGCGEHTDKMMTDYPSDYTITYHLGHVLQYDPMNIDGIDIVNKLDFFASLKFTVRFENSQIVAASFSNGDVPFSVFGFDVPEGEFDCVLNTEVLPNELRIKGTDHAIAYWKNGEFVVPFQLDSKALRYEYKFLNVE